MMHVTQSATVGREEFIFETGKIAKQAHGSVTVRVGDTLVLVTACRSPEPRSGVDFLPLSCDYIEKGYAAGRIPGSYFRREARPSTPEILTARLTDRPIRPLFPDGYHYELQVISQVYSADNSTDPSILSINGASAALMISDIPFAGPVAAVRVGMNDGAFIANPNAEEMEGNDLDLVVAVGPEGILMVEGDANFLSEAQIVDALIFAEEACKPLMAAQMELQKQVGKPKHSFEPPKVDEELYNKIKASVEGSLNDAIRIKEKLSRYETLDTIKAAVVAELGGEEGELAGKVSAYFGSIKKKAVRTMMISEKSRIDGRDYTTVRPIDTETAILPRAHGSSLFTRGETQALASVTLGTAYDEQKLETLSGTVQRRFMLHYNFLPFCVGEARFLRGTSRRELGHGMLAERGLQRAIQMDDFPYTVRVVSEIMESNGSSSMATVCSGSMALMSAGVPLSGAVGGVAMGLIKEGDDIVILTDILGDEDHLGDMDFKVIGSADGISGLQMDCKIDCLDRATMIAALEQAREARLHIIAEMNKTIEVSADDISEYAPRVYMFLINPDRIRDLIGPGGKHIRQIQADTDTKIEVDDDGTVRVSAVDAPTAHEAIAMVKNYTQEPEVGETYMGKVVKVVDFGAFVNIMPGTDGLVHISELAHRRVGKVEDVLREGDEVYVKCIGMERGKVKLSRKAALSEEDAAAEAEAAAAQQPSN
jgi:polyribonucleotide nucleotidyltransferase